MSDLEDIIISAIGVLVTIFIALGIAWFSAIQEANSFNKICKANVTTWDAVWLQLRVDSCLNRKD